MIRDPFAIWIESLGSTITITGTADEAAKTKAYQTANIPLRSSRLTIKTKGLLLETIDPIIPYGLETIVL